MVSAASISSTIPKGLLIIGVDLMLRLEEEKIGFDGKSQDDPREERYSCLAQLCLRSNPIFNRGSIYVTVLAVVKSQ